MKNPLNRGRVRNGVQFSALFLSFVVGLPNPPVFALRQTGLEEQTNGRGEALGPKAELVSTLKASPSSGLEEPPFGRWVANDPDDAEIAFLAVRREKGKTYPRAERKGPREHGTQKMLKTLLDMGYYVRFYALESADYFVFPKGAADSAPLVVKAEGTEVVKVSALPSISPAGENLVDYPYLEQQVGHGLKRFFQRSSRVYSRLQILERSLRDGITKWRAMSLALSRNPENAYQGYLQEGHLSRSLQLPVTWRFFMQPDEENEIILWAAGVKNLETDREYLAFNRPAIATHNPGTILARVLPRAPKDDLHPDLQSKLGSTGTNIAVTNLFPEYTPTNPPAGEEVLPVLLLRFRELNGKKFIEVYQVPQGDPPLVFDRQLELFNRVRNDPRASLGTIFMNFPKNLKGRRKLSNKDLLVLPTPAAQIHTFLSKAVAVSQQATTAFKKGHPTPPGQSVVNFPALTVVAISGGGLEPLWREIRRTKIRRADRLKGPLEHRWRDGGWTHLVLHREVRQRPAYGLTHFLVKVSFARMGPGTKLTESPLEAVAVLASNHPQWTGVPVLIRPLLGAFALGLINAEEVDRIDKTVAIRTVPISRDGIKRLKSSAHKLSISGTEAPAPSKSSVDEPSTSGTEGSAPSRSSPYDSGHQWIIDLPILSYSSPLKLGASAAPVKIEPFRIPREATPDTTAWLATAVSEHPESVYRSIKLTEDSSGNKWVEIWSPGASTNFYQPDFWVRIAIEDRVEPGVVELRHHPKGLQLQRMIREAEQYLRGNPADLTNLKVRMSIWPTGGFSNLDDRFSVHFIRGGRFPSSRGRGNPTVAILTAAEVPPVARGKRFVLSPPRVSSLRPFLRAVGDQQDPHSGTVLHVWLDDQDKHQVRINQLPPELGTEVELASDILTERGIVVEESKRLIRSLERNSTIPLVNLQLGKTRVLDADRINEIPMGDRVVAPIQPFVLIPLADSRDVKGVLVTSQEAVPLNQERFPLYQRLAEQANAGLEEPLMSLPPAQASLVQQQVLPMRFVVDTYAERDPEVLRFAQWAVLLMRAGMPVQFSGVATAWELEQAKKELPEEAWQALENHIKPYDPDDPTDYAAKLAVAKISVFGSADSHQAQESVLTRLDPTWVEWFLDELQRLGIQELFSPDLLDQIEAHLTAA